MALPKDPATGMLIRSGEKFNGFVSGLSLNRSFLMATGGSTDVFLRKLNRYNIYIYIHKGEYNEYNKYNARYTYADCSYTVMPLFGIRGTVILLLYPPMPAQRRAMASARRLRLCLSVCARGCVFVCRSGYVYIITKCLCLCVCLLERCFRLCLCLYMCLYLR